jgi:hypothetical protein
MSASPVSLEMQSKITAWRHKAAAGTLSIDEMKEAVRELRAGRMTAAAAANAGASTRAKAKVAVPSAANLLGELEGM